MKIENEKSTLILSQDKKTLGRFTYIFVKRNWGGKKNEKYVLVGDTGLIRLTETLIIGRYESEEAAIAELKNIYSAVKNGDEAYSIR